MLLSPDAKTIFIAYKLTSRRVILENYALSQKLMLVIAIHTTSIIMLERPKQEHYVMMNSLK